ncbi:SMC family ATPase [Candidatus Woesearchaeota archaeon]|jgi:DNA repair protein SbcC/Rad50|nr:SMC family ATPase [Candidatus Woesearchaeota archaeon]MBT4150559.1 SMC family ATPase [Candidatus Woesearchaeota archaeon]MBT4247668.1 SMC family ATPase [Candidatus Woesearchaeota archaeon]MBT4434052.1 SMC family ATPase [Candidatus Woesearchaeota archaeon]MBT7332267.1 SMC family ATPase [Candidatus Woesearchaeota archaeon]
MLLRQLKLSNIRSYIDETVSFPDGSIVLSGDIGCGKSTILLAIEFALFGTSRTDLPSELLLRKGTLEGSVELTFQLQDKEVVIKRKLKKDHKSIKQVAGFISVNGEHKDLTAVELKAEILNLLGYPEELLLSTKNFIYRYTVYTPQEEMKLILQENAEIRLDVLRKVFNIDKYKNVRNNLQIHLKGMRTEIAIIKTRLEPLSEVTEKVVLINVEKEKLQVGLNELIVPLENLRSKISLQKHEIEIFERQQLEFVKLREEKKLKSMLQETKGKQLVELQQQFENFERQKKGLPEGLNKEVVKVELETLEIQKSEVLQKKSLLQEKVQQLQQKMIKEKQEIRQLEEQTAVFMEKEELLISLKQKVDDGNILEEKKKELDEKFMQISSEVSKNQTLLEQAKMLQEKISSLEECPMCLQNVTHDHKSKISSIEGMKKEEAEKNVDLFNVKKVGIMNLQQQISGEILEWNQNKNLLTKTEVELLQLKEKKSLLDVKKEGIKSLVVKNNQLMQDFSVVNLVNMDELQLKITKNQEIMQTIMQHEHMQQQMIRITTQKENIMQELTILQNELTIIEEQLSLKKDLTEVVKEKRLSLQEIQDKEKVVSVEEVRLKTNIMNFDNQEKELHLQIGKFKKMEVELKGNQDLYRWLDGFFMPLMYTIEKHVMIHIHNLFNQLFQEWFDILIEDDQITARIDDTFSPLIEQNGYDVSFRNLSGGEKTSAALAYRLALNRVINDVVHQIKTKDLLILDEPTDGFSSQQLDKVRDVLEKLNLRQTVIVSHESKIESFVEHVIMVRKEGHVSNVYS